MRSAVTPPCFPQATGSALLLPLSGWQIRSNCQQQLTGFFPESCRPGSNVPPKSVFFPLVFFLSLLEQPASGSLSGVCVSVCGWRGVDLWGGGETPFTSDSLFSLLKLVSVS